MPEENVDVVVRQFEATNSRDFARVMDAWTDDVTLVLHVPLASPDDGATGKAAVGEWFGDWFRQFGRNYRFDIEDAEGAGDRVFVVATHHGQGRRSGVTVEQRNAYVYTLRDGRISRVEVWANEDRKAAREAAGLRQ